MILDIDVADLYGLETKLINEAVSRNPEKFPDGYLIELTDAEWNSLRSRFATSMKSGRTYKPKVFSEKGLYMLATVIKSPKAIATTPI